MGIIIFPGSKAEYEEFVKYKVEIVDTGMDDKGIQVLGRYGRDDEKIHFNSPHWEGVEAIVNAVVETEAPTGFDHLKGGRSQHAYGLPVRKAE